MAALSLFQFAHGASILASGTTAGVLLAGNAIYMPALMNVKSFGPKERLTAWVSIFRVGTLPAATSYITSTLLLATAAYLAPAAAPIAVFGLSQSTALYTSAALAFAPVVWTGVYMRPGINRLLEQEERSEAGPVTDAGIKRWTAQHGVRTALATMSTVLAIATLL